MTKKEDISAVFRLKPKNYDNKATIKYIGIIDDEEKLVDEIVELDKVIHPDYQTVGKNAIPIHDIGEYEMIGRIYRCNIIGTHLVMDTRYPLMYLNIEYSRPMVSGSLVQIFLSIDMNKEEKNLIKKIPHYVNLQFSGQWVQHIDCDDEFKENYEFMLKDMLENDGAIELNDKLNDKLNNIISDEQIIEWINNYVSKEREFYDNLLKDHNKNFISIKNMRDYYIELCQSAKFYKFLKIAMKCRDIHRKKEAGIEDDEPYIIPDNITKLSDIKQQMIDNDELIIEEQ